MTVREALRDAMAEEMRRDPSVFVMGEEVGQYQGAYKVTQGLLDEFGPTRVVDTPITEYGFAGVGVGAAFAGLKPIVEFMTWNFAMQAIDHIINSAAKTLYMSGGKMHCPIVFRGPNGAAARVAAQHSQNYAAWYAHVPGLKVIAPYTAADAKGLLKAAIRDPGPVVFLENEILYGQSFEVPKLDDFVSRSARRGSRAPASDVTIVSFSRGMAYALDAAKHLAEEGIEAEVIDLRTLRPLDIETVLASVRKTNRIVTVEEGWPVCSIGSEICARVTAEAFDHLDAPPLAVTGADVPMPYAANLEKLALPSVEQVVAAVKSVCYRSDADGRNLHELEDRAGAIAARCASRCWRPTRSRPRSAIARSAARPAICISSSRSERFRLVAGADKITTYTLQHRHGEASFLLRMRNKELLRAALQARRLQRECALPR